MDRSLSVTIHWKAIEQYFTVEMFNPLTRRVKPWVIQSFLTFDSIDRKLLNCTLLLRCLFFNFTEFVILSGVKGLKLKQRLDPLQELS